MTETNYIQKVKTGKEIIKRSRGSMLWRVVAVGSTDEQTPNEQSGTKITIMKIAMTHDITTTYMMKVPSLTLPDNLKIKVN